VLFLFLVLSVCNFLLWSVPRWRLQPLAFEASFLQSQISIDDLVLQVSFATFR